MVSPKRTTPLTIEPSFSAPLLNDSIINQDAVVVENVEQLQNDPISPYSEFSGIEELNSSPIRVFSDSSVSWYPDSEKKRCKNRKRKVFIATSSEESSDSEEEYYYRKKWTKKNDNNYPANNNTTPKKNCTLTESSAATTLNTLRNSVEVDSALPSTSSASSGLVNNILPVQSLEQTADTNSPTASTSVEITRWKKSEPSKWKKNVAKSNKQNCLPYISKKGQLMPAKMPKPAKCSIKLCRYRCSENFTEDDRIAMCGSYWKIGDYVAQKRFLIQKIIALPTKTKKVGIREEKHRNAVYAFYFEKNEIKLRVCKEFFMKTLCISNGPIIEAMKNKDDYGNYSKKDGRGCRAPKNKTSLEVTQKVIEHINKFPKVESHYCRKKTKRFYLDAKLTIAKMYELYKEERRLSNEEPCSFYVYKSIFGTKFNLSFFKPKKDLCLICTRYDNTGRPDHLKEEYKLHQERKIAAQQAKDLDKLRSMADDDYLVVTADMQSTLHIPVSSVGILYYTRKLNVQNYTIYTSKPPHQAYCITWNEIHGKRGSVEIASAINWWLTQIPSNIKEVTMYSDTCAGQNRNQFITAYFVHLIQQPNQLDIIEQKYLESGHTHMEVDSMHSAIEREQRNTAVYSMIDWKSVMGRARSKRNNNNAPPYVVKEMTYKEMLDVRSLNEKFMKNTTTDKKGKKIQWLKIKCLRFERQCPGIVKYRYSHDGPYEELNIFENNSTTLITRKRKKCQEQQRNATIEESMVDELKRYEIPKAYSSALSISEAKKKDLLSLCVKGVIPEELHPWFASLPTSKDVVDRNMEPDVTENVEEED